MERHANCRKFFDVFWINSVESAIQAAYLLYTSVYVLAWDAYSDSGIPANQWVLELTVFIEG